jgi:hypothetical protein
MLTLWNETGSGLMAYPTDNEWRRGSNVHEEQFFDQGKPGEGYRTNDKRHAVNKVCHM